MLLLVSCQMHAAPAGCTCTGGGSKVAKLETGASISVPLFINAGETIKIDTRTETYLSRAKE